MKLILIAFAGGMGSLARYLVSGWAQRFSVGSFPLGTLIVNVAGCLLIGVVAAAASGRFILREEIRVVLQVGFIGGFTTFSAFGYETFSLFTDGQMKSALLNLALNNVLSLAAVWLAYRVTQSWWGV